MTNPEARGLARALVETQPQPAVQATLAWSALVDVEPRRALGVASLGHRFIVPICGGWFWGGPGLEHFKGRVLPGGADRQLLRADGVKELRAEYELETDEGTVITVDNRVLVDETRQPQRYAMSHLHVTAPTGPCDWLNRRVFVGTLQVLRPQRDAVLVRAWLLTSSAG